MNKLTFMKMIPGTAEVRVTAASPAAFLNECARLGLPFRKVEREDACTLCLSLRQADLPRAEAAAKRCGCEFTLLRSSGSVRTLQRLRRQMYLCAGALTVLLGLFVSSLYIWDIRVTENPTELSEEEILAVLEEVGVGIGSRWPRLSSDMIRSEALLRLPELSYLTVNVHGSRAEVLVRGKEETPEKRDERTPTDICAARGGVITELRVLEGEQLAAVGDTVLPGDVLVSAARSGRLVHARAEVTARTWHEKTACIPLVSLQTEPVGPKHRRWGLIFGKRRVNFSFNSGIWEGTCDKITQIGPLEVPGVFRLPISLVRETRQELRSVERERDRKAAAEELRGLLRETLLSELCEGEILAERFTVSEADGLLYVTLRAECLERIDTERGAAP